MDLLKDNLKTIYMKFLIPSLGSAMVMSIYTLTDAIVIGKGVGAPGLAALSITTPLLCILMSTGILFGVGGSVLMSVHRGTGKMHEANQFFTLSFFALAVISLLLWGIYGIGTPQFLKYMGANEQLYPYARSYMKYINIFLPIAVFSNYIAIFIRADKDPNRAMAGVLLGGVVNIFLDILLVFPLQKGMGGAALASVLGMTVQVIVGGSHFLSTKNELHFVKPSRIVVKLKSIMGNGIPSFFNEFANGFIVLLFNLQILKYSGAAALSVYSVVSNCVILFNSLFTGVGQCIQPIISMNYGAGQRARIQVIKRLSFLTVGIMGILFTLSGLLFPELLCSVFMKVSPELGQIARGGLRIYFLAFLPMGLNLLTSYYFQAVLLPKQSLFISILRNIILSCILILVFPQVFGGTSLWMVMPIVEFSVLLLSGAFLMKKGNNEG